MILKNKVYDFLKFLAMILLPAIGTLYSALAPFWDLPEVEKVTGTILAIDTFLGAILGLSSSSYKKYQADNPDGIIQMLEGDSNQMAMRIMAKKDPKHFSQNDLVTFKVEQLINPENYTKQTN